tara:strand:+ start:20105 stop:21133 length:1029 start_codon:yes stop_codon:yes gene_type:complete
LKNANKIFSLHLNSNKPNKFEYFAKSFLENMSNPNTLEIIVHIDQDDQLMKAKIEAINNKYNNTIKYIESNMIKNFNDAWKPLNILLNETSDSVKIIACLSDDIQICTKKWDLILLKYAKESNKSNIFRIRCSQYKNEKYNNVWECAYKPDFSFYSKKWIDTVKCWSPCIGPDTYQEIVSFYLNMCGAEYNMSIVDNKISFEGEKILTGLSIQERIIRAKLGYKSFSKIISYNIQKKAIKSAELLANEISNDKIKLKNINYIPYTIKNSFKKLKFFHYRGSKGWLTSSLIFNLLFISWCRVDIFDKFIIKFIKFLDKNKLLKKFITNKNQYEKLVEALRNNE